MAVLILSVINAYYSHIEIPPCCSTRLWWRIMMKWDIRICACQSQICSISRKFLSSVIITFDCMSSIWRCYIRRWISNTYPEICRITARYERSNIILSLNRATCIDSICRYIEFWRYHISMSVVCEYATLVSIGTWTPSYIIKSPSATWRATHIIVEIETIRQTRDVAVWRPILCYIFLTINTGSSIAIWN